MSKKSKHNRLVINFFADIHCGSRLALLPPGTTLYSIGMTGEKEPWYPSLTPAQEELWHLYSGHIEKVMDFADGDPVCLAVVGDVCQGDKHRDEIVVSDIPNQVTIACKAIEEWLVHPNVTHIRLAAGTDAHEFTESSATRLLAEYLSLKYPKVDISWAYHELLEVDRVTIDFSHHGPGSGKRKYLEMNNASWYLRDIMLRELLKGNKPPDLVIRADKHSFGACGHTIVIGERLVSSDMIVIPSYQTLTGFARRVTQSAYEVYHGMVAVEVIDGEISRIKPFIKQYDLRRKGSFG